MSARLIPFALGLLAVGLISGCGLGSHDVSGKVYYKDAVVTSGFVTMIGPDGIARASEIAEDGAYQIPKVPAAEVKVLVSSPSPTPAKGIKAAPKRELPEGAPARTSDGPQFSETQKKTWRQLPDQYSDVTRSRLTYSVKSGVNSHDIKLE